jgi:hypothetical protein
VITKEKFINWFEQSNSRKMAKLNQLLGLGLLGLLGCKSEVEVVGPQGCTEKPEICVLVRDYPEMNESLFNQLAMLVYLEGDHTVDGDVAVANVLYNRYKFDKENDSNKFGKTFDGILKKPYAFESVSRKLGCFENIDFCIHDEDAWNLAYDSMFWVLMHQVQDNTKGATYFKTQENDKVWHGSEAFWLRGKPVFTKHSADIGKQRFYKLES